jgi:hypothetical protein
LESTWPEGSPPAGRFPALFEVRRLFWPAYETLGSGAIPEQGIAEFIDHIFLPNFRLFTQLTESWTQEPVRVLHRRSNAAPVLLDRELIDLLEVVVRQRIDERAASHPFAGERRDFDSVLRSRANLFEGVLFVTDATLWNSASGGLNELQKLWRNVALGNSAR